MWTGHRPLWRGSKTGLTSSPVETQSHSAAGRIPLRKLWEYVKGDWSNQLSRWLAMDECGLRLRGIVSIENAAFEQEVKKWGSSDFDPTIPALKFSFE